MVLGTFLTHYPGYPPWICLNIKKVYFLRIDEKIDSAQTYYTFFVLKFLENIPKFILSVRCYPTLIGVCFSLKNPLMFEHQDFICAGVVLTVSYPHRHAYVHNLSIKTCSRPLRTIFHTLGKFRNINTMSTKINY